MIPMSFPRAALAALALCALAPVGAQQAPVRDASVGEMVERLAPQPAATTRSLRNLVPQKRELDLVVQFDFDSARLQNVSKPLLDNLAAAAAHVVLPEPSVCRK